MEQAVQPRRNRDQPGGGRLAHQGLPDAEHGERHGQEQRVGIGAAADAEAGALKETDQAPAGETLVLRNELGMAAAQDVESGGPQCQRPAGRKDADQFGGGARLFSLRKVGQDVDRKHEVESAIGEGEPGGIALYRTFDAHFAGIAKAVPTDVHGYDGPVALVLHERGKITGATAGFERAADLAASQVAVQEAEEDLAHSAIPPEVALAASNVDEFRRVHVAAHAAGTAWPRTGTSWRAHSDFHSSARR